MLGTCNRPGRIYPKAGVYKYNRLNTLDVIYHSVQYMIGLTYSQEQQCLAKHQCPFIEFSDLILIKNNVGYQLQCQARAFQGCSATTTTTC
jgi:hypothetical protein